MQNIPQISDAEWRVMKVLWNESPLGSSDVIHELKGTTDWKPKTIKTLLSRLVTKNALSYSIGSRGYLYYPLVPENECAKAVSYTHLRAHETRHDLVCRLLLEKKKKKTKS